MEGEPATLYDIPNGYVLANIPNGYVLANIYFSEVTYELTDFPVHRLVVRHRLVIPAVIEGVKEARVEHRTWMGWVKSRVHPCSMTTPTKNQPARASHG